MKTADLKSDDASEQVGNPWASIILRDRRFFLVAFLCLLGLGSIFAILYYLAQEYLKDSVVQSAARYTEVITEFRTIYTSEVVARLLPEGVEVTHDYTLRDGAIPLPATLSMLLGSRLAAHETGVKWRLYSNYPFPWRSEGGPQDTFETDAIKQLLDDPSRPVFRFENRKDQQVLRYATADLMRPACVGCHNSHKDSPKTDWKVGDLRGVLAVTFPVVANAGGQLTGMKLAFGLSGGLFVLGAILLSMVFSRQRRDTALIGQHANKLEQEAQIRRRREAQLRRSNADLLRFAHIASHDLNEPLRKVMAFGALLYEECDKSLGKDGKFYLERMVDASKRMRALINGLLDYSRVSKNVIPFTEIDLNRIAEDAKSDLALTLLDTGGRIEFADLPTIKANEIQIRQLLQNLIANAIKFHRKDIPPIVKIDAKFFHETDASFEGDTNSVVRPGPTCHITVSDNGIGFSPKYKDKIFQIFERLHGRDEFKGTGIGLAVCRKVVERHGGTITADSQLGKGTIFTIILPLEQPNQTHEDDP